LQARPIGAFSWKAKEESQMGKFLSTVAKRKAMAARVSRVASAALGLPVSLAPDAAYPGEYHFRVEGLESERGPVSHITLDVCPRGVNVHIKFGFRQFSPGDSAKWNHYLWPEAGDTAESYAAWVEDDLARLLETVQLRPNVERANKPDMAGYWALEREAFAAACAAR